MFLYYTENDKQNIISSQISKPRQKRRRLQKLTCLIVSVAKNPQVTIIQKTQKKMAGVSLEIFYLIVNV